jgi:hypothetical protein
MKYANSIFISLVVFSLALISAFSSCTKEGMDDNVKETDYELTLRGPIVDMDSVGQKHNDFLIWLYENHADSSFYYTNDDWDFQDFVSRKYASYKQEAEEDILSTVLVNDTFEINGVNFDRDFLFVHDYTNWTQVEGDSMIVALKKVKVAMVDDEAPLQETLDSLDSGIDMIDDENFTNETEIINALTMLRYSIEFAYYFMDEEGLGGQEISLCVLFSAAADMLAAEKFEDDVNTGPMSVEFYVLTIGAVSAYSFDTCAE